MEPLYPLNKVPDVSGTIVPGQVVTAAQAADEQRNVELVKILCRYQMAGRFDLRRPDGSRDPHNAMIYQIDDPNDPTDPIVPFHDRNLVWIVRSADLEMWLNAEGDWTCVVSTLANPPRSAAQGMGGERLPSESGIPHYRLLNDAFDAYEKHCEKMGWVTSWTPDDEAREEASEEATVEATVEARGGTDAA